MLPESLNRAPTFLTTKKGSLLRKGDIIIANQSYAFILYITPDYITTDNGKRKFYPDHDYPVFKKV